MHENQTAVVESYFRKLRDSDTSNKAFALKSLAFLATQSKLSVKQNVEQLVAELEIALTVQDDQVDIAATSLLEQLIIVSDKDDIYSYIKRRLLRIVVRNLGNQKIQLRKMSHKCIVQFVRRYEDYDTLLFNYLREGIEHNSQSTHLKQKCINSLQSILIVENKHLDMSSLYTKRVFQNLIDIVSSDEPSEVQKAAQQCLLTICRLRGIKKLVVSISKEHQNKLTELKNNSKDIADALIQKKQLQIEQQEMSHYDAVKTVGTPVERNERTSQGGRHYLNDYIMANHMKKRDFSDEKAQSLHHSLSNEDVTAAQEMLKRIQLLKNDSSVIAQIQLYLPTLENNFNNQRTQLFTISVRIIQVILDIKISESRFYVRLVPSIVQRLNDQKFIIRNSVTKVIKQYLVRQIVIQKTYTRIWIQNFYKSLSRAVSANFKEDLINLLILGYQTYSPIDFDRHEAVSVLAKSATDKRKMIRCKAIECVVLVLHDLRRAEYEAMLRRVISADIFNAVIEKLQGQPPLFSNSKEKSSRVSIVIEDPLEYTFKGIKQLRVNTELESANQELTELSHQKKRYKSIKRSERIATEEIPNRRHLKKVISLEDQYASSMMKTEDEARRDPNNPQKIDDTKIGVFQPSPHRAIRSQNDGIEYIEKDKLQPLADPKKQVETLLSRLRDKSWKTQFQAINTTRSLVQFHEEQLMANQLPQTVQEILRGVLSLRSSISKNSLMCLDEIIGKLKRKLDSQSDSIIQKVMKKTLYTNQFLQGEVKKCLNSISIHFHEGRLITCLNAYKQHKSQNVKMNVLVILQNLIRSEKVYRKQIASIWSILLPFLDEPAFELRDVAKKNIQLALQLYPQTKPQLSRILKNQDFEKITEFERKAVSKMTKAIAYEHSQQNILEDKVNVPIQETLKIENKVQRSYTSPKKYSTGSASSTSQFIRLEEIEKGCRNYKDWKQRIASILDIFKVAFRFSREFCDFSNSARYMSLLCEHLEDPNVRVAINALTILEDAIIFIQPLIEDHLLHILLRLLNGMANKKSDVSAKFEQIFKKIKEKVEAPKLLKETVKLCLNPIQKTKIMALKQLNQLLFTSNRQSVSSLSSYIGKILSKLASEDKAAEVVDLAKTVNSSLLQIIQKK